MVDRKEMKAPTLKELEAQFKKLRIKGLKPFIKGKGSGKVKLGFETI